MNWVHLDSKLGTKKKKNPKLNFLLDIILIKIIKKKFLTIIYDQETFFFGSRKNKQTNKIQMTSQHNIGAGHLKRQNFLY